MALTHGGQLQQMMQRYNIDLDLSTGISPVSYPVPQIPVEIWQRLPEPCSAMLDAASAYYRAKHLLACSGTQAAIRCLPALYATQMLPSSQVWLPKVGYKEHEKAWKDAGYQINLYEQLPTHVNTNSVVIVINPNNPSGQLYSKDTMADLLAKVERANGWLIVDEAFMDVIEPCQSVIDLIDSRHLFVLRSVGKFFGLAGIRLGFVASHPDWLKTLTERLGPWQVNGPAQFIAHHAFEDKTWQQRHRQQLKRLSDKLEQTLSQHFNAQVSGTSLFKTIKLDNAPQLFEQLCTLGVYVRLCDEQDALRFGIPDENALVLLQQTLKQLCCD